MQPLFLFDLDGTCVDSTHRQGETLDDWKRMNTAKNIWADTLLPYANVLRNTMAEGLDCGILTSRVLSVIDYAFLDHHGLLPRLIMSRSKHNNLPCGQFKLAELLLFARTNEIEWDTFAKNTILFDDDLDVQKTLRKNRVRVIAPESYNNYMEAIA